MVVTQEGPTKGVIGNKKYIRRTLLSLVPLGW